MKVEYINPFIEASQTVLMQMANLTATLGKVYLKDAPYNSNTIVIIVGITGNMRGQVNFTMSRETAMHVASNMMNGMPVTELDEISKSAISELTNMILGNTATILSNKGIGIEITPPSFIMGENIQISPNKMRTVCVPLQLPGPEHKMEIDISVVEG